MIPQTKVELRALAAEKKVTYLLKLIERVIFKHPHAEAQFKVEIDLMKQEKENTHGNNKDAVTNN